MNRINLELVIQEIMEKFIPVQIQVASPGKQIQLKQQVERGNFQKTDQMNHLGSGIPGGINMNGLSRVGAEPKCPLLEKSR